MSVETASQQVVLSVSLNSTPSLPLALSNGPRTFEGILTGPRGATLDAQTGEWLTEMQALVAASEAEYQQTHGSGPGTEVFRPTDSLNHLRRKENVTADEERRCQRLVSILSQDDQELINLWDDDDDEEEEEAVEETENGLIREPTESSQIEESYDIPLQPAILPRGT